MKVTALIQARMGSTRFPAKVLVPILGKPMLQWQLERLSLSKEIDRLVVATSVLPADDAIAQFCERHGATYFRGSEESVLDRFYQAGLSLIPTPERSSAILVRLTGDCPLSDPHLIDEGIEQFKSLSAEGCRYLGYDDRMPDGMDFEVFTWGALEQAFRSATDSFEKEHATPYMWRNPQMFQVRKFYKEGIEPGLRFSVDYDEDRQLVEAILLKEKEANRLFGAVEIAKLLASDENLRAINGKIIKNEGMIKTSLESKPFRVVLNDGEFARCGVAVGQGKAASLPDEMISWAGRMGVGLWCCSREEMDSFSERLKQLVPPNFLVCSSDQLPRGWRLVEPEADWETALLSLAKDAAVEGLFLGAEDRIRLAQMLMFLCQKRFSL